MPFHEARPRGTIDESFRDLIEQQGLKGIALVVEFTGAERLTVERWFSSESAQMPVGERRVRLMCFLELAGYEVSEFQTLHKEARFLAWMIAFHIKPSLEMVVDMGYHGGDRTRELWRIILAGGGYSPKVGEVIVGFKNRYNRQVGRHQQEWRQRLGSVEKLSARQPTTEPGVASPMRQEHLATTFQRMLIATTSLGSMLLEDGVEAKVLGATRNGIDIRELISTLKQFLPQDNVVS